MTSRTTVSVRSISSSSSSLLFTTQSSLLFTPTTLSPCQPERHFPNDHAKPLPSLFYGHCRFATTTTTTGGQQNDATDPATSDLEKVETGDSATTTTDTMTEENPEEDEAAIEKRKMFETAKEFGIELDEDGLPRTGLSDQYDSEELLERAQQYLNPDTGTPHHRSTNIGVPASPDDPVAPDGKTVRIMFCYSKYEIMEGTTFEDNVGQFLLPLSYEAIVKVAADFYGEVTGSCFSLDYYHEKRWHRLDENCTDILEHYYKEQILHSDEYQTLLFIRMPFNYDTSDQLEEAGEQSLKGFDNVAANAAMGKNGKVLPPPPTVQDKIIQMMRVLRKHKFRRHVDSPCPYDPQANIMDYQLIIPRPYVDGADVALSNAYDEEEEEEEEEDDPPPMIQATRDFVLNEARKDFDLRDILLLNVHALSHIVKCLHYDIYWKFPLPKRQDLEEDDEYDPDQVSSMDCDDHDHSHDHHEHGADCRH